MRCSFLLQLYTTVGGPTLLAAAVHYSRRADTFGCYCTAASFSSPGNDCCFLFFMSVVFERLTLLYSAWRCTRVIIVRSVWCRSLRCFSCSATSIVTHYIRKLLWRTILFFVLHSAKKIRFRCTPDSILLLQVAKRGDRAKKSHTYAKLLTFFLSLLHGSWYFLFKTLSTLRCIFSRLVP